MNKLGLFTIIIQETKVITLEIKVRIISGIVNMTYQEAKIKETGKARRSSKMSEVVCMYLWVTEIENVVGVAGLGWKTC